MFASIRRYHLSRGSIGELTRRVDEEFADRIGAQGGFVSYELVDCGGGEVVTISIFRDAQQAEGSRELAQRWTEERLGDFGLARTEALHGEILVSRAGGCVLEPAHAGGARKFASLRRYSLRGGSVPDLMHLVDESFADELAQLEGFAAYHALDCRRGKLLTVSVLRDQPAAEESDERSLQFVREKLGDFDIERTEVLGGEVLVSRAVAEVLQPAHA